MGDLYNRRFFPIGIKMKINYLCSVFLNVPPFRRIFLFCYFLWAFNALIAKSKYNMFQLRRAVLIWHFCNLFHCFFQGHVEPAPNAKGNRRTVSDSNSIANKQTQTYFQVTLQVDENILTLRPKLQISKCFMCALIRRYLKFLLEYLQSLASAVPSLLVVYWTHFLPSSLENWNWIKKLWKYVEFVKLKNLSQLLEQKKTRLKANWMDT